MERNTRNTVYIEAKSATSEGIRASFEPHCPLAEEGLRARQVKGWSLWFFLPCCPKVIGFQLSRRWSVVRLEMQNELRKAQG